MNLTDEQKQIGKDNFNQVVGTTRRDFFKNAIGATAAGAGAGSIFFNYPNEIGGEPLRVGVIGTGDEGSVLIGAINPKFVQVKAIADIRPYSIHRAWHGDWYSDSARKARPGLIATQGETYGYANESEAREKVAVYQNYEDLLADDDIEAVIIALPLWIHAEAAIKAMRAGKHVLTEKLMAWSVGQCKEMARVAEQTGLLLATGHQRHYSILYDNAVDTIKKGIIGDIHHIRAQWHRGNLPGKDSWQPPLPGDKKLSGSLGSWQRVLAGEHPKVPKPTSPAEIAKWERMIAQKQAQIDDISNELAADYGYQTDTESYGYERSALEELIRWRLWNRTGGGLMAELGSHQLDASGIFISSQFAGKVKVNPLSVTAVGGRHIFPADRDVDDHVYCTYEYPGKGYYKDDQPQEGPEAIEDENKKVVVTYSSINGNGFGGYGEIVMGTKGTLILEREKETMLYAGSKVDTRVKLDEAKNALVDSYETGGAAAVAQEVVKDVSRGYREEIEHWAWCIRNDQPAETLHCHPKVALADAVIALTTNIAIKRQQRIDFNPDWFKPESDATPEVEIDEQLAADFTPRQADDIA